MIFVWIAYGFAALAAVLLALHVRRRYPAMPERIPLQIGIDGRPGPLYRKIWVWYLPGLFALFVALLGIAVFTANTPSRFWEQFVLTLVVLEIALFAYFLGWLVDRLIELARRQTYRIAPVRIGLVLAAIGAPSLLILAIARLANVGP
jgi:hypothetical protein